MSLVNTFLQFNLLGLAAYCFIHLITGCRCLWRKCWRSSHSSIGLEEKWPYFLLCVQFPHHFNILIMPNDRHRHEKTAKLQLFYSKMLFICHERIILRITASKSTINRRALNTCRQYQWDLLKMCLWLMWMNFRRLTHYTHARMTTNIHTTTSRVSFSSLVNDTSRRCTAQASDNS